MHNKRKFYRVTIIFILLTIAIVSFDIANRSSSFSTPLEALENVEDPILTVQEPIKTIQVDDYAYIFFYSQVHSPKDYIGVSKIKKGKYGWKQVDMLGAGFLSDNIINGDLASQNNFSVGLATLEVSSVIVNQQKATIIPLNEDAAKIWFVTNIEDTNETEIQFLDNQGKPLN
ncbi:hypothetical protein [Ornithinibacillus xuwenensis]|jgi:hypothetical protein|uniref:Uncharacterized protein n=1 Tax=Ornithinibacillus xuwenensis TaxID=3144668 RepID=A0ABU9XN62_9BACI